MHRPRSIRNDSSFALQAVVSAGDSGHYGTPCFQFDGINVSSKLSPPTPEASVTAVLRDIEYRTRPAELKRRGWEMDHMNDGGFAAIRDAFVTEHGLSTIHKSLYLSADVQTLCRSQHHLGQCDRYHTATLRHPRALVAARAPAALAP